MPKKTEYVPKRHVGGTFTNPNRELLHDLLQFQLRQAKLGGSHTKSDEGMEDIEEM